MRAVLVIEDDTAVRESLRLLLEDEDFEVIEAGDAEEGLARFDEQHVDLAIVDLKLPGRSGFDVCRAIRAQSAVPIVIVTAQVDSHDIVLGLELGADDYVTKPFVPRVLTARLRALLRRVPAAPAAVGQADVLVFGHVAIVPGEGEVRVSGRLAELTKTEFRLLCELAEHAGQVISRDTLLQRVWGYDYPGDGRLVDSHIRRLRTKIELDPANPVLITTVRGLGYKLQRR